MCLYYYELIGHVNVLSWAPNIVKILKIFEKKVQNCKLPAGFKPVTREMYSVVDQ